MNRVQKNVWFGLGFSLVANILIGFIFTLSCSASFQTFPWIFGSTGAAAFIFIILLLCSFIFRRRRSGDIEADERDRQISTLAIKVSFASVWLLLFMANFLIIWNIGILGDFPPIMYIFVHLGAFIAAVTIYFSSILVLYRLPGRIV